MNNTLYINDVIMVNKLKYGPKIPRSPFEIPWLNIAFHFNENAKGRIDENWWKYRRLAGYSKVKNGDVLVYDYTFEKKAFFVKRCVGVSGDTLKIEDGQVFINDKPSIEQHTVIHPYYFKIINKKKLYTGLDSLQIDQNISNDLNKSGWGKARFSVSEVNQLKQLSYIDSVQLVVNSSSTKENLFANAENNKWSKDNMGPFVIPKKGMQIQLNDYTFALYKDVIYQHEHTKIYALNGQYFIEGEQINKYVFEQNYYFMMGDNRYESYDSRFFGFLPEKNVIGKVEGVLWSNYKNEFQWDRFLKAVN